MSVLVGNLGRDGRPGRAAGQSHDGPDTGTAWTVFPRGSPDVGLLRSSPEGVDPTLRG